MSMTPSNVRDGLKTRLATITGLRTYDIVPDGIAPPAAVVGLLSLDFDMSMQRYLDHGDIEILIIVGRMSERAAQDKLDSYLSGSGTSSIKAAIEGDTTLGGSVQTCRVLSASPTTITVSGAEMLCYRYQIEVVG
ncbi:hypothetical protein UFOVP226_15 [uncultured Caudovirales phage]|uniref:Tail completion protein n=1 Tax=uncultured Caudovirales phage TaxID=2100421 RepID=A0A6J7WMK1_9CAUD|nr:hypothetical protein UFOVP226_15 [uncultured Caudovirales phage]